MTGIIFLLFLSFAGASEQAKQDLLDAYTEEVASHGAELDIELQWDNKSKNAHATRWGNTWRIVIGGNYLNKNDSVLRLLLCHELGHHLGGAPYKYPGEGQLSWVSSEGQADYFTAKECAHKLIPDLETRLLAAEAFTQKMWSRNRKKNGPKPLLTEKSKVIVNRTLTKHPEPQCRLDTYVAGFTCPEGKDCRPACWYKSP